MTTAHSALTPVDPTAKLNADISGDRIVLTAQHHHIPRLKAIPGSRHDKTTGNWTVPLTYAAAHALYNDFGLDFAVSADLNDWGTEHRNTVIGPANALRELKDLDGLEPGTDRSTLICADALMFNEAVRDGTIPLPGPLYDYQLVGASYLATVRTAMLLDEMGLGKTNQAITALRLLAHRKEDAFPALVVCPASVLGVWKREIESWYPGLTVAIVRGTATQRAKILNTPAHVYVIAYSSVAKHSKLTHYAGAPARKTCTDCGGHDPAITPAKCQVHDRELNKMHFATVIIDEAHRMLSPKSVWTQAVWSISDKATNRFALTGTPIQDNLEDFWSLLRFVDPTSFPSKTQFMDRYALMNYSRWGTMVVTGIDPRTANELRNITRPFYRRILKNMVLTHLPPVYAEHRVLDMSGAQLKAYKDMLKTMIAELEDGTAVIAESPLTKATRLIQFSSSYAEIYTKPDGSEGVLLKEPSNKISGFLDDIAAGDYGDITKPGPGIVVFAQSRQLIDILATKLDAMKLPYGLITGSVDPLDRERHIDEFQAGKTRFILCTISAGGAGVTLTAADTMVYLQRSWSKTDMDQSIARAHRIGSERHDRIRVVHYLSDTPQSVEQKQLDALLDKANRVEEILEDHAALKRWIEDD